MVEGRDGGGVYIQLYIRIGISLGLERGRKVYFRDSKNMAIEMSLNQGRLVHRNKRKTDLVQFVSVQTEIYFCLFRGHPNHDHVFSEYGFDIDLQTLISIKFFYLSNHRFIDLVILYIPKIIDLLMSIDRKNLLDHRY
jgi:hypothetical protein